MSASVIRVHQPPQPTVIEGGAEVVRIVKPRGETIDLITTPADLGTLDVPQPTEPMHIGSLFKAPPPRRAPWHRGHGWGEEPSVVRLFGCAVLIVALIAIGVMGVLSIFGGPR